MQNKFKQDQNQNETESFRLLHFRIHTGFMSLQHFLNSQHIYIMLLQLAVIICVFCTENKDLSLIHMTFMSLILMFKVCFVIFA